MTTLEPHLLDPDFLMWVAEHASDEDRARFLPLLRELTESAKYDWERKLRPTQRWPEGDYSTELKLAGRGFGKSLSGAVWVKGKALEEPGCRIAVMAPTFADARDTCVEGESGVLAVTPPAAIKAWNRSLGELIFDNGSRIKLFSGDEPDRLRGPQHHYAWVDELAAFRYDDAWDQLMFGLRLGERPQVMVTTTPRPTKLVRALLDRPDVHVTRGSTFDNAANLAPSALEQLKRQYEGTRIGRQELYGEVLLDVPGALWSYELLEATRVQAMPEMRRVVVAIDPAVTSGEDSDETGIVVAGTGIDGDAYVLADRSGRFPADEWARRALNLLDEYDYGVGATLIAEVNNGGDLVEKVIRTIAPRAPYKAVRAMKVPQGQHKNAKIARAAPVAALYEQGRVHHVGVLPELEEQFTSWVPEAGTSPDRLDAAVWALTELMLEPPKRGGLLW